MDSDIIKLIPQAQLIKYMKYKVDADGNFKHYIFYVWYIITFQKYLATILQGFPDPII